MLWKCGDCECYTGNNGKATLMHKRSDELCKGDIIYHCNKLRKIVKIRNLKKYVLMSFTDGKTSKSKVFIPHWVSVEKSKEIVDKRKPKLNLNIEDPKYALKVYPYRFGANVDKEGWIYPRGG